MNRNELAATLLGAVLDADTAAFDRDCENIVFLLRECEIDLPTEKRFFGELLTDKIQREVFDKRVKLLAPEVETEADRLGARLYAYTGRYDFSHTCPFWEDILSLGIFGLWKRLSRLLAAETDPERASFYRGCHAVYGAALDMLKRSGEQAQAAGQLEKAEGLKHLAKGAPRNLFECLQTMIIYYNLQHTVEGTFLRVMGRLDALLYPHFVAQGEGAEEMLVDFIREIDQLHAPANIPFSIGGQGHSGDYAHLPLSFVLLDIYGREKTTNTKLHILCGDKTPEALVRRALKWIRAGRNSIVFMSTDTAVKGLVALGAQKEDAENYHVVGCYECGAEGELTCSCNARANLAKAVEVTLCGGRDMQTGEVLVEGIGTEYADFEAFYAAFLKVAKTFAERAMEATNRRERVVPRLHTAPVMSATYPSALAAGGDLYGNFAAKYNNSSLNLLGLGTAVDALAAIRCLVFEQGKLSLGELCEVLKNDWAGAEPLRLFAKNRCPKYGTGHKATDALAVALIERIAATVNGKPNVKGGVWRLGTFSIDWRWSFGAHTAATPDGRRAGDPLSQNTSATFGAEREGATAHLLSVSSFPHTLTPNGSVADIDLHESAVSGENGITAMHSALCGYFARGGIAVQYNVLNTEVLKKARRNPDAYPHLQVRLCGWNVLFSSLSDKEKDEFIARAAAKEL